MKTSWLVFLFCTLSFSLPAAIHYSRTYDVTPPEPTRELRATWIGTIININWPLSQGLTSAEQKKELLTIIETANSVNLNTIFFQVRPACDAFYKSSIEPWSEFLTGTMGKPPAPFYDPLTFAVEECHKRGIELHAWINPFRARFDKEKVTSPVSKNHVSKLHPNWICEYGNYLWLDPGEPQVRNYVLKIVIDIIKRYDIDGIHFDDYFYPYKTKNILGKIIPFPDKATKKKFGKGMSLDNWRRQNINEFVESLYTTVKMIKPWVKVGISPFGIWRPGVPKTIKAGVDAFGDLYADSKLWLNKGWLDYFVPQLYWRIDPPDQSYPVLLNWWITQNTKKRILAPGNSLVKIPERDPQEIINQIALTRKTKGTAGNALWSVKPILENRDDITTKLGIMYNKQALIPHYHWLKQATPNAPSVTAKVKNNRCTLSWKDLDKNTFQWLLQTYNGKKWRMKLLPKQVHTYEYIMTPRIISLRAVNKIGALSSPIILRKNP